MARLSKHGQELYRHESLTSVVAHMADGQVMKNDGLGWKLWKRVKDSASPQAYADKMRAKHKEAEENRPAWCAFRAALKDAAPINLRWKIVMAIESMPDDPDGCWATFDDDYAGLRGRLSFEDCNDLCRLYKECKEEGQRIMDAKGIAMKA